jgi:hypothetical protein
VGGWQLGKRIWASKGADPGRGKWYGAILGFLLGFIGILTLLGISWKWHPASEPLENRAGRSSLGRVGNARVAVLLLTGAAAFGAVLVTALFLFDAQRYSGWAVGMSDTDTPINRAACSQVTTDWDACFVRGAARRTDSEWKAAWERQSQNAFLSAGIGVLVTLASVAGFVYAVRRQPTVTVTVPPMSPSTGASEPAIDWPPLPERSDVDESGATTSEASETEPDKHSPTP